MSLCKSGMDLVRDLLLRNRIGQSDGMPLPGLGYKRLWLCLALTLSRFLICFFWWQLVTMLWAGLQGSSCSQGLRVPLANTQWGRRLSVHSPQEYKSCQWLQKWAWKGIFPQLSLQMRPQLWPTLWFQPESSWADDAAKLLLDTWPIETVSNTCFKP